VRCTDSAGVRPPGGAAPWTGWTGRPVWRGPAARKSLPARRPHGAAGGNMRGRDLSARPQIENEIQAGSGAWARGATPGAAPRSRRWGRRGRARAARGRRARSWRTAAPRPAAAARRRTRGARSARERAHSAHHTRAGRRTSWRSDLHRRMGAHAFSLLRSRPYLQARLHVGKL